MSQHIGSRTISATGGSIKRVGNYRVHTFPSEVVSDGLVFHIDAGHPDSHDYKNLGGSSSLGSVNDISGFGNNGAVGSGSPDYVPADGGSFTFDPGNPDNLLFGSIHQVTGSYTIEIWFKSDSVTNYRNIFDANYNSYNANAGPRLEQNSSGGLIWYTTGSTTNTTYNSYTMSGTLSSGSMTRVVLSRDIDANLVNGYFNGNRVVNNISPTTGGAMPFNSVALGVGYSSARHFDGSISIVRIYNRALSHAEIEQNYDASKIRFQSYSNTFTPVCAGTEGKVEVLCVAGGGGGGRQHAGGGGGAGGLVYNTGFSLTNNSAVSLTVGQGGLGGATDGTHQWAMTNGGNSTFSTITATGGGKGGEENSPRSGTAGGSGGGGSGYSAATTGGAGTSGQGNAGGGGGTPSASNTYGQGGGGGGAGGVGGDGPEGTNNAPGNGGDGLAYDISGELRFYAGGGGGGSWDTTTGNANPGGLGGSGVGGKGGAGGSNHGFSGQNGVPNTGSGGGGSPGSAQPRNGGHGSNGTVIVRYPATDYNVEVLVVGAGGGGGSGSQYAYSGGGGGAGGFIYKSKTTVVSGQNMKVAVGRGGSGGSGYNPAPFGDTGSEGSNSRFGDLIAIGGGAGGAGLTGDGTSGGSGGGGGGRGSTGGSGTAGQGFAGGNSSDHGDTTTYAGGGGGAGGPGESGSNTATANGGTGISNSITGSAILYAQGGAGGSGASPSGTPVDNTGQGGRGGVGNGGSGADGTHGIVVVVYKGPQRGTGGTVDTTSRPGYTIHKFTTFGIDTFIS